ncbi:hypothetical protein OSB04_030453, partial [Centaurea solstitialis]
MMHVTKQFQHLKIQLEAILSATNNFSDDNCIGYGGFGKVYKGELIHSEGRQTMVAIKRLNRAYGQGDPEFWKEIIMLSRYKHENIVSLLGFCDESGEKILVYEYASKKSLDLYLKSDDLTWIQRLKICIGAARGLAYLHNPGGTQQRVLHRDIKSSNILLDESWNARISDLGLSKFGPANQQITFLVSNAVGTIGYCDPVYVETGVLTKESDVYSFGVVLFEVLCGRLCIGNNNDKHQPLTGLARQCYEQNKVNEIIYGNIKDEIKPKSLKAFTAIAYQCLKRDLEERPLMNKVVKMLERALEHQQGDANSPADYDTDDEDVVESDFSTSDGGTSVENLIHPRFESKRCQSLCGHGGSLAMTPGHLWSLWGLASARKLARKPTMLKKNLVEPEPEAASDAAKMLLETNRREAEINRLIEPSKLKVKVVEAIEVMRHSQKMSEKDIYPLDPEEAATKVTEFLMEMDPAMVHHSLESPEALIQTVAEAMEVLRHWQA